MSETYRPPMYRNTLLPGTSTGVPVCDLCAAVTLDAPSHDGWHAQLWVALLRSMPKASS